MLARSDADQLATFRVERSLGRGLYLAGGNSAIDQILMDYFKLVAICDSVVGSQ
jgi:hypothetical protein